jgi:hypothetical protein
MASHAGTLSTADDRYFSILLQPTGLRFQPLATLANLTPDVTPDEDVVA